MQWPRVNSSDLDNLQYMLMDESGKGKVVSEPIATRMKFWEELATFRDER